MIKKKKIIQSLSGGIDSTTTLLILKINDFYVESLFIKNWSKIISCTAKKDFILIKIICKKLKIKINYIDTSKNYWTLVFCNLLKNLKKGFTINPDIKCNEKIKFNLILNIIINLNYDKMSTGHYAENLKKKNKYFLKISYNKEKDQTYFLSTIKKSVLKNIIFPINGYSKNKIKIILKKINLINKNKKNSTGICFIENNNFKNFIEKYIKKSTGPIIDYDNKNKIGLHDGHCFYTIGEKLFIKNNNTKYYIYKKNIKKNILYVKTSAKITILKKIKVNNIKLNKHINKQAVYTIKLRHQGLFFNCIIKNQYYIIIRNHNDYLTPGQQITFYKKNIQLYSTIIVK